MAKILYISCHAILEHDEIQLFTELGHEVFSCGAYTRPEGHYLLPRPGIRGMKAHPALEKFALEFPRTNLAQELIDWADIIIFMHSPQPLIENWSKIQHKKVVFRSIGQSTQYVENQIRPLKYAGLKIVRMSPMERNIPGYVGDDAIIRFYADEAEYGNWVGSVKRVINFTQTLKGRRTFCHYDHIMQLMTGFPALVYGTGNDDLGGLNGGELPYDLMKGALRDNRVAVYAGTWPSPYTMSLMEYMMTGIPVVAIGRQLAQDIQDVHQNDRIAFYEVPNIIKNGENGFISDNINDLRACIQKLLDDDELAKKISQKSRETAKKYFGKTQISEQWKEFLAKL